MVGELLKLGALRQVCELTPDALQDLQDRKLRAAVQYAYDRVPLYRERLDAAGIRPSDVRTIRDLARLPETTKQDLQTADTGRIIAAGVDPRRCTVRHTNGSTGTPLRVYLTREDQSVRSLIELRSLQRLGVRFRDRLASVGPLGRRRRRLHERLGIYSTHRVSGDLPPQEQLARLSVLQPTVLWFYPTMLRALLAAADGGLRDWIQPRMLITSAEMLDDLLREQVRNDLGVDPYSAYGANETGRIAMECPAREGLHINTDHVVLESWAEGRPAEPSEAGAALVTTLDTDGMPLLRYRLGDRVRLLDKRCSCGSPFPLMDMPGGREHDVIVLPSGRLLAVFAVSGLLRVHLDILQFRVVQPRPDRLQFELVTREPWPEERLSQLQRQALERLGEPMTVDVRTVERLPPDNGVKFRYFVSLPPPWPAMARPVSR